MSRLFLLLPVAVAVVWFVRRYREGAFRRVPDRTATIGARPGASAEPAPAWVYTPEEYGLVPDDQLDLQLPGPDPHLKAALGAAASGDWRPASAMLAASDPERRWIRVSILADSAAQDDTWVRNWRAAQPGDPTAVLVEAQSLNALAWALRGSASAGATTREQFENFHHVLGQASAALGEAARLAPYDPSPYIGLIRVAIGLGQPHEQMRALWSHVAALAPYHVGAHSAALQYWSEKWNGSPELMHGFAESAAATAPPGSLLPLLRLVALYEELMGETRDHPRYRSAEAAAAVTALLADVAAAPADHPWLPAARHLLVWFLLTQRRIIEAAEQLRMVDGCIGALPWRYHSDPVAFYSRVRKQIVMIAEHEAAQARAGT
jgi:hypothetical protein